MPVLVEEVIACLNPKPGEIVADCTVGYGGHASEFLKRIGPTGKLIAMDTDNTELERTRNRLSKDNAAISFHHSNFAGLAKALKKEGLAGCDIIFADLGVSSMQIDNPERGMSYKHQGPIDMRMDSRLKQTGADLLNTLSEEELSKAFLELADEPDHKKIAEFIVNQRKVTADYADRPVDTDNFQRQRIDRETLEKAESCRIRQTAPGGADVPGTTHISQ